MTASIPARRSPDGYVAQQLPADYGYQWVVTRPRNGGLEHQLLGDDDVADWPVLGEEPHALVLGPDQVLIVACRHDVTPDQAATMRDQLRERLGVADVLVISGAQTLTVGPAPSREVER